MDVLTQEEINNISSKSKLTAKYNEVVDSKSAYEMLTAKLEEAAEKNIAEKPVSKSSKAPKPEPSTFEKVTNNTVVKGMLRTAGNGIVRSLLGALGLGGRSSVKKTSWF